MRPHALANVAATLLIAVVFSSDVLGADQSRSETQPWYRRCLVGMEVGPTGAQFGHSDPTDARYCSQFDGADIVRHCAVAKCQYVVLWVRDGDYAYYDSKLLLKAPGLGSRDPLRDGVQEARKQGLPLIAYCVVQQAGHYLKAHPEWEMRGANGQPIGRFCLNSGYLEAMEQIVAEQLAYGIDGFHIDMLDQGFGPPYGCWCDTCRTQFEKEYGHAMPAGVTWDESWDQMLEFRYRSSERFEQALAAYIKQANPQVSVDFNYHGNPPFSFEVGQRPVQHAGNGDFITGETGMWGFGALPMGLNVEFYRAAVPHQRVQVAINRGVRIYHDQTTRPLNDLRYELFNLMAHGAFVTVVDKMGFDGSLDPLAYERLGQAFQEAQAKQEHWGKKPVFEVGLYYSSRSRDWTGREQPLRWMQSFLGAHKALVYEHIPYGVVLDENLSLETLQQFPVVLLPNVTILSESEVVLLDRYVQEGGKLIVTGFSGQFDRLGRPASVAGFESLIGAKATGRLDSEDNWMRFSAPPSQNTETAGFPPHPRDGWAFLVKGPGAILAPTTATAIGELLKPYRTTRQREGKEGTEWPLDFESPVGPAVLINQHGQGTVLTFAGSPDYATASEHHLVEARRLLSEAVRFLHSSPRVRIEAPTTVETIVTDDADHRTLRVHLLGYNSPPQTMPS
jgi:hypothetical protein